MIARFFALTFCISWAVQLPAVLAALGVIAGPVDRYMNLAGLGLLGPMFAALILARFEPAGPGVRAFLRSVFKWRVHPLWYVAALTLPAIGFVAVRGVYGLVTGYDGPWLYPPANPQRMVALIVAPIGEELGWRGYVLPRLQRRYSRVTSGLVVGAFWGIWHLLMAVMMGMPIGLTVFSMLFLLPFSLLFSWLYNRTGGSALLALVLHAGVHLNNPNQVLPGQTLPFYLNIAGCALLGLVVLLDRSAWRGESAATASAPPAA